MTSKANSIIGNINSCFSHHRKGYLISFTSIWNLLKIKSSLSTSSFIGSFMFVVISKKLNYNFLQHLGPQWHAHNDIFRQGVQMMITWDTKFFYHIFNNDISLSRLINEDIKCKFLNLWTNIKSDMLQTFFFHIFPKKKKTPQTSFMMLEVKKTNSRIMNSVSIRLSKNWNSILCFQFLKNGDNSCDFSKLRITILSTIRTPCDPFILFAPN